MARIDPIIQKRGIFTDFLPSSYVLSPFELDRISFFNLTKIKICFIIFLATIIGAIPVHGYDADYDDGMLQYSILSNSTVGVYSLSYNFSSISTIEVPETVTFNNKRYNVTSILGFGGGEDKSNSIKNVILPSSIERIDDSSFLGLKSLVSIILPKTVTYIGRGSFQDCISLKEIAIPDNVQAISGYAFKGCTNLRKVSFGLESNLKIIENEAFNDCRSLKNIQFPPALVSIGEYAFARCNSLTEVILPNSISSISSNSFAFCEYIEIISVPGSLKIIPKNAFYGCNAIKSIYLGNGITTIEDAAFSHDFDNNKLQYVIIPPSVVSIGNSNFEKSNVVIFNGNITLKDPYYLTTYIILDTKFPKINGTGLLRGEFYTYDKNLFLETLTSSGQTILSNKVHQLNEGIDEVSVDYTGYPQGLDRNTMQWPLGELLRSMNVSFNFHGIEQTDCGHWQKSEQVTFEYDNWSFTTGIKYDFTIKPIPLTVSLETYSRKYGEENPEFIPLPKGFVANDNFANSINEYSISCSAKIDSEIGSYPIIINGKAKNYTITFVNGVLNVTKAPLTVTAVNAERMYGDNNPTFTRSYLGFKLNDTESTAFTEVPAIVSDATNKSDVGTYPITVSGGVAKNYEITEYTPGTLTVTKAPLVLTADDAERLYYAVDPDFTFSLDGLRNDDTPACITKAPTYTCTAAVDSDCGEYSIMPSATEAKNYEITYKEGKLTVKPEGLILVASDIMREYGDSNPILKYEAVGLKGNDDLVTSITEEPVLTTTATESSNVGEYPISISGGSSKNYNLSYRQGALKVTKAPLTVMAVNAERMYGDNNPTFTRSYLGFKLNDTESTAFSTLPVLNCTANKYSTVGEYPITVSGGNLRNYEVVKYESGVLNITKAPLVLTANEKSRLYYTENPLFDYTLKGLRNNDTKSCLSTQPSFTCNAVQASDCGTYAITPSNAVAENYNIEYKEGNLSIEQRNLTASVGNYTKVYGNDNPDFAITYEGFVNGENELVLTNAPVISCNAEKMSDVGEYPITLSGGDAKNYVITKYNSGKITVGKADQTITWNQDLSNIAQYSQVALDATSSAGLPVTYEMSPNNVASLYDNAGTWYLDCYGTGAVNIRAVQNGDKNHNAAQMISKTLVVKGNGSDPSNPQIYLHVETAGTLPNLIADNRKHQIKNLRLTGYLNGTDINYLREMTGCDCNGKTTPGVLETLDISGCTIVSGGRNYYSSYKTANYKVTDYMFYNCKVLVNLMLPENTVSIGNYAFADCDRLSVISIPDKVSSFGNQLFRNDISLLRIPMPNSLTSIGDYAFMGCNGLSEITIPAKVSYLGDGIVKNCQNIARINVVAGNDNFASENGVLYTSSYDKLLIFPVNYNSSTYTVREGTTRIAPYAFVDVKKLNDVVLPESLLTVGQDAFIGCVNLSTLRVKALTPPVCDNECFEAVSKTRCELVVPNGCYSYYWVAPVWSGFNKIRESDFSSIDNISSDKVEVSVEKRGIVINGLPENIQVYIFQLDGKLIYRGQSGGETLYFNPAASGTYLVVIANKTYKVMIR